MKKLLVIIVALSMTFTSCDSFTREKIKSENTAIAAKIDTDAKKIPVMNFDVSEHDFGTIKEGTIVEHTFSFTNTGNAPLLIINAKGSCGCTVPKWSKEPIAPGEKGELTVSFNSNGKPNLQNKKVTITANTTNGKETLTIKAMVTPKAK